MIWGLTSGGWMGGLYKDAEDSERAQLELLASYGLKATAWSARHLMRLDPGRREELTGWLAEFDISVALGVYVDYWSDDADQVKRGLDGALEAIETLVPALRSEACTTGLRYDSFTRQPSLEEQWDRASRALGPLAEAAHRAGAPLGIHNAGHYCSDLAELCRRTPHLGIFMDTGNPFLAGERPARAARDAAPFTVGTHFKDHHVWPNKESHPLCLEIKGAVLGGGDACIREVYRLLKEGAPNPQSMPMLMEIDPVHGLDRREALERCLGFVRGLDEDD